MEVRFDIKPKTKIRMQQHDAQTMLLTKPGSTLYCDAGILWVTQANDNHDYVLMPGQKMIVTRKGKVLIEAMRDADFRVA